MKLIKPSYEIIPQAPGLEGIYKQIELAGRVCYKSEDKITEDSAKDFTDRMIKSGHLAMCEHGTVYLHIKFNSKQDYFNSDLVLKYHENPYSKIIRKRDIDNDILGKQHAYITTNYRVLIENNWLDDLKYLCEPTEYHEKRVTVKFITDIGCGREILRHRVFSFANESTRYCNYSKGKFNNELTFIIPSWSIIKNGNYDPFIIFSNKNTLTSQESCLLLYLKRVEEQYMLFVENDFKPQEARAILPLCTKSELVVTGFVSDWKHFFDLRTDIAKTGKPHPDLLQVTNPLYEEFIKLKLI